MKRVVSIVLAVAMLVGMLPTTAWATEMETVGGTCGENLTWTFDESSGSLKISGTGDMDDYSWSQMYDPINERSDIWVTNAPWRDYYSAIKSIVIESDVTIIGDGAFRGCVAVTSISLSNDVEVIGEYSFMDCDKITDVVIPENVKTIGEAAFGDCNALEKASILGATSIGNFAFSECASLESIALPGTLTSIGEYAFRGCEALKKVTIPSSVRTIGAFAFVWCESLDEICFEGSAPSMDGTILSGLTCNVSYPSDDETWSEELQKEFDDTITWNGNSSGGGASESSHSHSYGDWYKTKAPTQEAEGEERRDCTGCDHYETRIIEKLPSSGDPHEHIFNSDVTLPTCTEQGYTTYSCGCGNSYVDDYVDAAGHSFGDWYVTKEATEESEGEEQRDCSACDHYETRTIEKLPPSEEDTIGGTCGENLTWLRDTDGTLTISGAGKMDEYASASDVPWHKDRERITSLIICEEVASLNKYAFYECTALESIYFKATAMEDLSSSSVAFYRAGVNGNGIEVVVGEGVSQIPAYLFYVSSYSSDASANIVTVNFEGDSVCKSIGDWAFRDCSALASITIPKSVTSIGRYAFYYCFNLLIQFDAMELPKSLGESWDNGAAICLNAKSFGVTEYGQKYWVTNENTVCVWKYDGSDTELVIPETIEGYPVVEIAVSSFSNCTKITSVTIPDNTTTVGSYAFYNCTGLTSITIPQNVTTLGENVFYNCTSVESIYYNSIAMNDFTSSTEPFGFTSPTSDNPDVSLVIGCHVTRIPAYLFYSYYSSHAVPLTTISFEEGSVCESIGVCAFHCSSLTTVTIPNSVKEINTDAFASCKNLTSITFEEGSVCESIGNSAFISSGLTAVTIPGSVQKIQAYAFGSCRNLVSISFCGNVPTIEKNSFSNVTASAYYPNNNDTWTDERLDNYGGTLTWIPYDNPQGIHKHNHSAEITEPTCTDQGYTTYTCSCGDSYVDDYVDSTGHIYGDWYETVAPVQGQLGEEQRDCENCDVYETRTVVSWSFDESTGTLTITGNGAMRNYDSSNQQPWYEYSDSIEAVILEEGVLSIGTESFSTLENVTYVNIPNSVQAIGNGAFNGCTNLEAIYFAGSKLQWNAITVGGNNSGLEQATIFYSTWNGEVDTDFVYSSGAYLISGAAELAGLAKLVNEGRTSGNYRLAADIDLNCSDSLQWVPIGNINNPSYIDLDGDGYTISSLFIGTNEDYQGLFGYAEMGNIENIVLKNALVQGREYIGGIIGYASNYGRTTNIRGCVVEGGEISGTESVGGVIGGYGGPYWGSERTVERCLNSASVVGGESIGGIIGSLYSDASNVTSTKVNLFECANLGNINGSEYVGGIIGKATLINGVQFVFNNCYNHGCISSSDAEADPSGGIAGYLTLRGLGNASKIYFYNCHNAGSTVKPTLGDFQWTSSYHKFTTKNSYYLLGSCEPVDVEGLEGLTKSQMKTVSSFENWDFSSIWKIDDTRNHGYPYLQWAEKWVDITEDEKDDSNEASSTVRYFRKWDADTQTAYWGEEPPVVEGLDLGSQVTEETDTSFLADVDNLVGTHVLAETKTRDDGMIAADILLSIKPLETKTGTITAIGFTTITIDGVEYSIPENVNVYDLNVGDSVMYHLYNGDLVGIDGKGNADLEEEPDKEDSDSKYKLVISPEAEMYTIEVGQSLQISCDLYCGDEQVKEWDGPQISIGHKEDADPVSYTKGEMLWAGSYLIELKGIASGTAELIISDISNGATINVTVNVLPVDETEFDDPSKAEWVEKHIQYATSSTYQEQIVDGFPGALQESFEVIKSDKNITAYNTLDKFNDVLGFNISDLSETQKYELLLTQILFSRNGVTSIENIYNQYLNENALDIIRTLLNDPDFVAGVDDKEIRELKENLNVIEKALPMGIDCAETINNVLQKIKKINTKPVSTCIKFLKDSKLDMVLGFINYQQSTLATTVDELIMYLAAGDAYMRTSVAFGEVLLNMRRYLNIPSDIVDIYPQALSGETLLAMLGRDLPGGYPNGYDVTNPFDIPISIRELCWAIENIYVNLEAYKQDEGKLIAKKALETYKQGSILNVYGTGMGIAESIMECVPLLEAFSVVKKFFDGTQFAIDLFTEIDDKATHGTMVMRLYCIARIHYLTVNSLATSTTLWGKTTSLDTVDRNKQYDKAMLFDESVAVYRAILNVASEYAQQYHAGGYNLPQEENHNYVIQPGMISPLEAQQKFFNYDWCHQSLEEYLEESGAYSWDPKNLVIYEVKCPVEVIVKDTSDTVIAVLRNGNSQIAKGYERYFFTTETVRGSGDYLKIAMVPTTFAVTIEGTDIGWMNAAVTDYANQQIGETRFFYNVPITDKTIGNFVDAANASIVKELIVDNVTFEGDTDIPVKHVTGANWIFDTINHWHTCTRCDEQLDVSPHSGGTATCTKEAVCTVCGASYGELASHDYETSWSQGDANGHWHECKNCSVHDTQVKHTPGAAATESTAQTCTECGYVIAPATGHITHTAGSEWLSDGNSHWHKCTGCNEKLDVTTHSGGTATCTKKAVCSACGTSYGELASHDYESSWSQGDANGHWHECKNCSAHDAQVKHTPDAAATETTAQFCTVCDYVITPALGHTCTAGSKWYSNGTYHWHVCISCGAWVKTSYHSYSSDTDETCNVCGYIRTVTVTEPSQETEVAMTETTEATDPGEEVIATETAPTIASTETNENLSDNAVSEDTDSHGIRGVLITVFAIVALGSLTALVILLVYKKRRESK